MYEGRFIKQARGSKETGYAVREWVELDDADTLVAKLEDGLFKVEWFDSAQTIVISDPVTEKPIVILERK